MVRIALGQLNTTVGDLDGNVARMADCGRPRAAEAGADLVVLPGARDHRVPARGSRPAPEFVQDNLAALEALAAADRERVRR